MTIKPDRTNGTVSRLRDRLIPDCLLLRIAMVVGGFLVAPAALAGEFARVSPQDYPDADAVVLSHSQTFSTLSDGRQVYEEHRFVQLLNDRSWRRYADPRADYLDGAETVELLAARTHLPDGATLDIPDYSINIVSPAGITKWPAFSGWRQAVYTFSGIQNGAVLEWHYRRTSQPGTRRWLQGDLRIGNADPIVRRTIVINTPGGQKDLRVAISPVLSSYAKGHEKDKPAAVSGAGLLSNRWEFADIPAMPDESASPPWQNRCGRFQFINCTNEAAWREDLTDAVKSGLSAHETIREIAEDARQEAIDKDKQIRSIAKTLRDTLNVVNDTRSWVARKTRTGDVVLDSGYGSPLEIAGLWHSVMREAGFKSVPRVMVNRREVSRELLTDADVQGIMLTVSAEDYADAWTMDPANGVVNPKKPELVSSAQVRLEERSTAPPAPDSVRLSGRLALKPTGDAISGTFTVELTEGFVDGQAIRDDDKRDKFVRKIVGQWFPNPKLTDLSYSVVTPQRTIVTGTVESSKAVREVPGGRLIQLNGKTPALTRANLPLATSLRLTDIELPGQILESVDIRIDLPDDLDVDGSPRNWTAGSPDWGRVKQDCTVRDRTIQFSRELLLESRISVERFDELRDAIRPLESPAYRTWLLQKTNP
ncbi:MAG: DUF3857 domain-containing protein [Planctomycetota bacterium]|jgi:hypothetical protein